MRLLEPRVHVPPLSDVAAEVRATFAETVATGARSRGYRKRVLLLLALTLALDYADRSAIGALGPDLKRSFHVSNTELGLVASIFSVFAGLMTVPAGVLVDRTRRTIVLAGAVALWSAATAMTGAATSFAILIAARVFLGSMAASARPALLSITGDVFPANSRGQALGLIGTGELAGDGLGFVAAGAIAAFLTWRGVFWALGACGVVVVYLLWRLPEPPRCGRPFVDGRGDDAAAEAVASAEDVAPDERLVRRGDQSRLPLREAIGYVLSVRTQVLVMAATAIGSFFFGGLRTFIIVFAVKAYGVDRTVADLALLVAGVGGIAGILAGGRIGDALIRRGRLNGRLLVGSYSYLVAVASLVPAFLLDSLWLALPAYVLAAAALAAPLPPLDAVRLDVIHPQLWGRAEGIRSLVLVVAEAGAPLLFGVLSDRIAGGGAAGLRWTFLLMLSGLVVSAAILQVARRFYPSELAAAGTSARTAGSGT